VACRSNRSRSSSPSAPATSAVSQPVKQCTPAPSSRRETIRDRPRDSCAGHCARTRSPVPTTRAPCSCKASSSRSNALGAHRLSPRATRRISTRSPRSRRHGRQTRPSALGFAQSGQTVSGSATIAAIVDTSMPLPAFSMLARVAPHGGRAVSRVHAAGCGCSACASRMNCSTSARA
jgi:hypothetical protein